MTSTLKNLVWKDRIGQAPTVEQLFIPNEYKKYINPSSMYFQMGSPWQKSTIDKLFLQPHNIRFLQNNIWFNLTENPSGLDGSIVDYNKISPDEKLKIYDFVANSVPEYFRVYFGNDTKWNTQYKNPVMALHELNHRFVMEKVKGLRTANIPGSYPKKGGWPNKLPNNDWVSYYPLPNVRSGYVPNRADQSYYPRTYINNESFRDGQYHPEDSITNQPMYEAWQPYMNYVQNRYVWDQKMEHGSFPIWQRSLHRRNVDRDNSEGLRYGGMGETVAFQNSFGSQAFADLQQNSIYENEYDPKQTNYRSYWMGKGK